jgi:hypothetical protein
MARDSSTSSSSSRSRSRSRRSRSRSGSRRRDRSRSRRSRDRGLSRSVSRDLLDGVERLQVAEVPRLIKEQQDFLVELISEHKEEVDQRLQTKTRRFASKALERQFEVNGTFKEITLKSLAALKRGNKKRVKSLLKKLRDKLEEHEEDLIIADTSPNGWLAVSRIRGRKELPDKLRKKLDRVDRELWRNRGYGRVEKKFGGVQGQGSGGAVRTRRQDQRQQRSPEELLYAAARQTRAGVCSHCRKENHFYRECPDFWRKVQEAREERVGGRRAAD